MGKVDLKMLRAVKGQRQDNFQFTAFLKLPGLFLLAILNDITKDPQWVMTVSDFQNDTCKINYSKQTCK